MCGFECCISANIIHTSLSTWRDCHLKHLKDRSHNAQNRIPGEISSRIFETYKNAVQPHVCHIYNIAADMSIPKMCPCNFKHHGLPHWKFVLCFCDKCPIITLPSYEENKDTTNTCPTMRFHVYRNTLCCTM